MDIQTLYDANLNDLLSARYAYEALTSAFAKHIEEWQITVVNRLQNSQWTGDTADRVHGDLQAFGVKLQAADDELRLVAAVLADAHESIALAQAKLIQVQDDAKAAGITIKPDGVMSWENDPNGGPDASKAMDEKAHELSLRLQAALAEADHADQEISRRLRHFVDNATSGTGLDAATAKADHDVAINRTNIPDPKSTSPDQAKAWWNGLTPEEQHELIHNHPDQIGNLDGIPATDRNEANRLTLTQRRSELQAQLDQPEPEDKPIPGAVVYTESLEHKQWREKRDALTDQLKGMDAIQTRLDAGGKDGQPPAYLLGFDTDGKGHAIVAVNNLDTADNVVTYVPGTGSRLGGIKGEIERSEAMVGSAQSADGKKITASISWVGYDAPQSIVPEAADDSYAKGAEDKLHNFEVGLRTTHEGPPARQTIIGHSYGTTTVGYAMRDKGLPVDAVMFVGSPGTGVDNAKDLGIDPNHVWAGVPTPTRSTTPSRATRSGGPRTVRAISARRSSTASAAMAGSPVRLTTTWPSAGIRPTSTSAATRSRPTRAAGTLTTGTRMGSLGSLESLWKPWAGSSRGSGAKRAEYADCGGHRHGGDGAGLMWAQQQGAEADYHQGPGGPAGQVVRRGDPDRLAGQASAIDRGQEAVEP